MFPLAFQSGCRASRRAARRSSRTTAIAAALLVLCGCSTDPPEDPSVAAKCTPVQDLLQKNFEAQGGISILGNGLQGQYERSGVVLDKEEATRLAEIDFACRAWATGGMPGPQYTAILAALFGGTASVATGGNPRG